jgi:hypothetical protein
VESRVVQALIRFGHWANMKRFKLLQVFVCLRPVINMEMMHALLSFFNNFCFKLLC